MAARHHLELSRRDRPCPPCQDSGRSIAAAIRRRTDKTQDAGPPSARAWVSGDLYAPCAVSEPEMADASARARADIVGGKRPVARGGTPHLLVAIGAAGVGKSTVAGPVAAARDDGRDYAVLDYDLAVKYHPRFRDVWDLPDVVTGGPTGVGLALGYLICNDALEDVLFRLFRDLLDGEEKYNLILQTHSQVDLISAKVAGYRTTLLFVGAPLAVAQKRSRRRAVETGKFLAATLQAQDDLVEFMWTQYGATAPWYGLWADEFLVADNRRDDEGRAAVETLKEIDLRTPGDWRDRLRAAEKAIAATYAP